MNMFRELNKQEVEEFKKWARDNFDPKSDTPNLVWHPVIQQECAKMLVEIGDEFMVENFGEDGLH